MSKVAVQFENIALSYGATAVLRDIDFAIAPGEFFALLGPSGSGKSTLLRVLAGFAHPDAGRVLVDGRDISSVPPWDRDIGMVFQNYALWPHMTVAQNVAFGLEERRLPRAEIDRKVADALRLVGLEQLGARRPSQLSGGQQQRVALARTIAIEPKVLLLDEPLSNLDAKLRVHMRSELLSLQRKLGITTVFVTHDQEEALSIADRVAVLDQGVIQQIGTPMELYDYPVNRFIAQFVGTINLFEGEIERADGNAAFVASGLGRVTIGQDAPASGRAQLAIRPHAIRLSGNGAQRDPARVWLEGTVAHREFLGEFVRYVVRIGEADLTADEPHYMGGKIYEPGEAVGVGIERAQFKLLNV
ncbi:MAG: ABC transporter ATP-binding protein [Rhodospirillaceae bacterium]